MTAGKQTWDAGRYARNARFVSDLGMPVVELLAPQPGEHVLDVGCGDGALTEKLVAMGCHVIGVDGNADFVKAARARGLDARVADGERLQFDQEFDAVFSNAALHWMKRADAVIDGVWRALKPKGRFIAEFGGYGNIAKIITALYAALARRGIDGDTVNPWYFPTVEDYRPRLEARGFEVTWITLIPRPTPLPADIGGWLETFALSFSGVLSEQEQPVFLAEVQKMLRPQLCDAGGQWTADYVRLRFAAIKRP